METTRSGAGQPQGYNGSVATDGRTTQLYSAEGTNYTSGKIGFQFGSWPGYSFGGIFGRQTAYDNNTVGDISFDFRRGSGDSALTESIVFNSLGNAYFYYGLTVSGVLQSPLTSLLGVSVQALESSVAGVGVSARALENNKMDALLVGTSVTILIIVSVV